MSFIFVSLSISNVRSLILVLSFSWSKVIFSFLLKFFSLSEILTITDRILESRPDIVISYSPVRSDES